MKNDKIGPFIRKLRTEKGWSQELLASKIFCTRLKIHRLENNIQYPDLDDIIVLSEVFEVKIEEIVFGEYKSKKNQKEIQSHFLYFLKFNNLKFKRIKFVFIFFLLLNIFLFFLVTSIYFFQNYRSIHFYKFFGSSENYQVTNGLFILSKDKVYFDVKQIVPAVEQFEIYSEVQKEKKLVYKGSHENILNDFYGYGNFISYKDFINGNQKLYLKIKEEEIELTFVEEFINDSFWYNEKEEIGNFEMNQVDIPKKILKEFNCNKEFCFLNKQNEQITFNDGILNVSKEKINMNYDMINNIFTYQFAGSEQVEFLAINGKITCEQGNCENASKILEDFQTNYIKRYLE